MLYSTTRLRFTLHIIGASLTLNHLQEIDVMQASARDMQLILAAIWLLAKAGISMYFTSQHVSASLPPERTAVQQWNLQLLWAWRSSCLGELTWIANQTIHGHTERVSDSKGFGMDLGWLWFSLCVRGFHHRLGDDGAEYSHKAVTFKFTDAPHEFVLLDGKYGGTWSIWSHGFAPGLLSRCCLLDFEASHYCLSHTHTITRTPAIPAQMPLCSLFEQVFNLLVDISADVRAAAVTALSRMRDRGQASYSDC